MIEIVVKDNELQIYVNRKKLADWLKGEGDVPWDGDPNSRGGNTTPENEEQGYKDSDGEKKDFPNPVEKGDSNGEEDTSNGPEEEQDKDVPDGVNLFEESPGGVKGELQEADKAKEKLKALRDWMKDEKFNYRNFCLYLYGVKTLGGFKLSTPPIGVTQQKKEPTLLKVAHRFYTYWLGHKDTVGEDYKKFLLQQLDDMGVTIQMVKDELDGEEIDPKNLPKGVVIK